VNGPVVPARTDYSYDLFVSYAHADVGLVRALVERLRNDGCLVWFDESDMRSLDTVAGTLAAEIERSRQVLICLSDTYCQKDFTKFELRHNHHLNPSNEQRRTIPIVVGPLDASEIPKEIGFIPRIDLSDPTGYEAGYQRLKDGIFGRSAPSGFPPSEDILALSANTDPGWIISRMIRFARQIYEHLWQRTVRGAIPSETSELVEGLKTSARMPRGRPLPKGVLAQIDAVQRFCKLIDDAHAEAAQLGPGIQALAGLSDWVTKEFDVVHPKRTPPDLFDALARELDEPHGAHGRPRVPGTDYLLIGKGHRCDPIGAIYPALAGQSAVDVVLAPVTSATAPAFTSQAEAAKALGNSAVIVESCGRFELQESGHWGFLALKRIEGVSFEALEERFAVASDTRHADLLFALIRQIVKSYATLRSAFPGLVDALFRPEAVLFDRSGDARLAWSWTTTHGGREPAASPVSRRDQFFFSRIESPGDGTREAESCRVLLATVRTLTAQSEAARQTLEKLGDASSLDQVSAAQPPSARAHAPDKDRARRAVDAYLEGQALKEEDEPRPPEPRGLRMRIRLAPDGAAAWPLGDNRVLVWGTDRILSIYQLDNGENVWRDSAPIHVRVVASGAGGRVALGGWEGEIRWFSAGQLQGRASAGWTLGAIQSSGGQWLAGSWNGRVLLLGAGAPRELLRVEQGVFRIAASDAQSAILGLNGSITLYQPDGTRIRQMPAIPSVSDVAYANGSLVVLTPDGLVAVEPSRPVAAADRLPACGPMRLVCRPADGSCLVLDRSGQTWRIDRHGTYPSDVTMPSGDESLMMSADLRRCTVAAARGGYEYWSDGVRKRSWPEARSAAISADGRSIVVTLPNAVEAWEDEA
jgi:hypothetical protein